MKATREDMGMLLAMQSASNLRTRPAYEWLRKEILEAAALGEEVDTVELAQEIVRLESPKLDAATRTALESQIGKGCYGLLSRDGFFRGPRGQWPVRMVPGVNWDGIFPHDREDIYIDLREWKEDAGEEIDLRYLPGQEVRYDCAVNVCLMMEDGRWEEKIFKTRGSYSECKAFVQRISQANEHKDVRHVHVLNIKKTLVTFKTLCRDKIAKLEDFSLTMDDMMVLEEEGEMIGWLYQVNEHQMGLALGNFNFDDPDRPRNILLNVRPESNLRSQLVYLLSQEN